MTLGICESIGGPAPLRMLTPVTLPAVDTQTLSSAENSAPLRASARGTLTRYGSTLGLMRSCWRPTLPDTILGPVGFGGGGLGATPPTTPPRTPPCTPPFSPP